MPSTRNRKKSDLLQKEIDSETPFATDLFSNHSVLYFSDSRKKERRAEIKEIEHRSWSVPQSFISTFLPAGYPTSVTEDYLSYQLWDTAQAFCSSVVGGLATQAFLTSAGVGDEMATVLSALWVWTIRGFTHVMQTEQE